MAGESEWKTRKKRIDPKLDAAGWRLRGKDARRTEEEETAHGPADYALWLDQKVVGVIEAKKLTVGPQNVLTQAERYSRGLDPSVAPGNYDGHRAPFLYATNGEVVWFHDVRHPLNRSRRVSGVHTASALRELLDRDLDAATAKLAATPNDGPKLRPYQRDANAAVERAIAERKRHLLVAMATGTGKTFTMVNQVYRLMKSGVAKRILFLVDRRALAAQAVRAFSSFDAEPGRKFDSIYEVFSSKFQKEDFGEDEKFDPKTMPKGYLTDPQPGHAFVYVCTIQRMAINVLGRQAIFGTGDEAADEDADRLDIPIHAFDAIIGDECHRGYTSQEVSTWRSTLDHFDATKIGLTATPASHTTAYFTHKVFEYPYEQAVRDGHLVDYDVVNVRSNVRMEGVFLKEGEQRRGRGPRDRPVEDGHARRRAPVRHDRPGAHRHLARVEPEGRGGGQEVRRRAREAARKVPEDALLRRERPAAYVARRPARGRCPRRVRKGRRVRREDHRARRSSAPEESASSATARSPVSRSASTCSPRAWTSPTSNTSSSCGP